MTEKLTAAQLAEIEARAKAATPGEWEAFGLPGGDDDKAHVWVNGRLIAYGLTRNDARLVAHARTDIPALLRDLRAAREALRQMLSTQAEYIEALPGDRGLSVLAAARAALPEETPNG